MQTRVTLVTFVTRMSPGSATVARNKRRFSMLANQLSHEQFPFCARERKNSKRTRVLLRLNAIEHLLGQPKSYSRFITSQICASFAREHCATHDSLSYMCLRSTFSCARYVRTQCQHNMLFFLLHSLSLKCFPFSYSHSKFTNLFSS